MPRYINQLQAEVMEAQSVVSALREKLDAFLSHLESDKFRNDPWQERKDWIATADVRARLQEMRSILSRLEN